MDRDIMLILLGLGALILLARGAGGLTLTASGAGGLVETGKPEHPIGKPPGVEIPGVPDVLPPRRPGRPGRIF